MLNKLVLKLQELDIKLTEMALKGSHLKEKNKKSLKKEDYLNLDILKKHQKHLKVMGKADLRGATLSNAILPNGYSPKGEKK